MPKDIAIAGKQCTLNGAPHNPYVRLADSVRYKYDENKVDCVVCEGVRMPWAGWWSCDSCGSVAWIETGEVFPRLTSAKLRPEH